MTARAVGATMHYDQALRCPQCHGFLEDESGKGFLCRADGNRFEIEDIEGVPVGRFVLPLSETKSQVQSFWGDLCSQWYRSGDTKRTLVGLERELTSLEDMFRRRKHLGTTEMPLDSLGNLDVCEIGSGGGAHSALFRRKGAHVASVDITAERVMSTAAKLVLLRDVPGGSGFALQADAEALPFAENSFDIVYSNGVLHHTENTNKAIAEAHRVLKPGGRAVLMLYAKSSALYWLKLWPEAFLRGWVFSKKEESWLGRLTEGKPVHQSHWNPITRAYTEKGIRELLSNFREVRLRKSSFTFGHVPLPASAKIRHLVLKALGCPLEPSGPILYGEEFISETGLEMVLGPWWGFDWNIEAIK